MNARTGIIYVGTASWNIPKTSRHLFSVTGTQLEKYGRVFNAVEINSSFYRPHRKASYERWASSVGEAFRFSVKVPKKITHELRLKGAAAPLREFIDQVSGLGEKLGCLLIQLPPSLDFDEKSARTFWQVLRDVYSGHVAFEPRHRTWLQGVSQALLDDYRVASVCADPNICNTPSPRRTQLLYLRLHGTPQVYYSNYSDTLLKQFARQLMEHRRTGNICWCIFDNTALGHATSNAIETRANLESSSLAT